jgi:hypothetical protein
MHGHLSFSLDSDSHRCGQLGQSPNGRALPFEAVIQYSGTKALNVPLPASLNLRCTVRVELLVLVSLSPFPRASGLFLSEKVSMLPEGTCVQWCTFRQGDRYHLR